jgi:hypothetical protein
MELRFELRPGYLRAEARRRETVDETRGAHTRLLDAMAEHGMNRVLAVLLDSRPIFKVESYNLSAVFDRLAAIEGFRMALVSDSAETYSSHQYVQLLAQQRGLQVRAFRDEAAAEAWLLDA